ncbi:MAG: PAS domain S-box protein [Bacteroidia bacterium]|nr:PAS domain S-box protein [Bacteroidia bacterium]
MEKQNINSTKADLLFDPDAGAQADQKSTILKRIKPSINRGTAVHLFLILIFSIFIVDAIIMLFINALPPLTQLATILLDASLLLVVLFPILYFFVFRPLMGQISERNRAEETLVILKKAIYTSGEAIFLTDREGVFTFVNPAFTCLYGYSSDEIIGKATPRIIKSGVLDKSVYEIFWQTLLNGNEVKGELINKKKDGTLISTEGSATPIFDTKKNIIGFLGIQRDIAKRKHAEEMLLTSEKLYRSLFENMLNGFAYCQMHFNDNDKPWDFTYLSVNSAFENLTGLRNVVGKKVTEVIPGIQESDPELLDIYGRVSLTGKPERFEILVSSLQQWFSISVYCPEKGCFVAVFDVITERKLAEGKILDDRLLLRTLIDNIPDSIYCKDIACRKTLTNLTELQFMGAKSEAEVLGKDDFDFYPKELAEKFFADDQSVMQTGKPVLNREEYILDENKHKRWLLTSKLPLRDKDSRIIGLVGIGHDVTERKQAEEALRKSEEKYRNIYENTQEGIFQTTVNGTYISVNPALAKMYGYESPEELMKSRSDIAKESYSNSEERDRFLKLMEEQGSVKGYEYEVKQKDGHKIWFYEDARAIKDECGKIQYFEGFVVDITEHKQAEVEIKLKNEELSKANSEKDKFFSIIAHDLRSPFNGFLGLTQIMADESSSLSTEEFQQMAASMEKSASNLFRLLENLLHWARVQQGLIPFNPIVVQLLPIADESIAMVLEQAKIKGIKITHNIPNDLKVFADINMVQTIIRNLLSNAVKFTLNGGTVILSAKPTGDNFVVIAIKDTGIGMNQTIVEQLFRLDVQTGREGTEGEPSTGLGLLLCKEFVEKHGGKIWVESEEGVGSTFYFSLASNNT